VRMEFSKGIKQGWQREWNEKGELVFQACFDQNQLHGPVLTWWSADQIRTRASFHEGKKEGKEEWFSKNGRQERLAFYQNDLLHGQVKEWFPDGQLHLSQNYDTGKPVGEHILYYPKQEKAAASLAQILHYGEPGKFHGEQKTYFPNGQLQTEVYYNQGECEGTKRAWDPQGHLVEEASYVHGKLNGMFFQRMSDGREILFGYKNHFKNGPHTIFYPLNERGEKLKALTASFEDDLLQGIVAEYDEKGVRIVETPYSKGEKEGEAKVYFPDGKVSMTIQFQQDRKNGLQTQYFPGGTVFRQIPFVNDVKEGEEQTYYESGERASIFCYKNDRLEGLAQSWNQEGIRVFEAEYVDGQRHGKFNKYYEDGKPYIEQIFAYDEPVGQKRKYERNGDLKTNR